jgi:transposase
MQTITTIGLDIAKSVFQVHGVDAAGQLVIRRQRPCRQTNVMSKRPNALTSSIVPRGTSFHRSVELP